MKFKILFLIISILFITCIDVPNSMDRDNIFDPGADFDNIPPLASFSISHQIGLVGDTRFYFDASESKEIEHPNALLYYKWDFDGDGLWDTNLSSESKIGHTYSAQEVDTFGYISVYLYVKGGNDLHSIVNKQIQVYKKPTADLDWKIKISNQDEIFFNASNSLDCKGDSVILYRWDIGSDGNWDTGYSSNSLFNHSFNGTENWSITLGVKDKYGFISSTTKAYKKYDLSDMVGGYFFNGNANELNCNELNGQVLGALLTEDRFHNSNSAYYFDGVDDYIDLGDHEELKPESSISISFWLKAEELTIPILTNNYNENSTDLGCYFKFESNTRLLFGVGNKEARVRLINYFDYIKLNKWHHIVGLYSSSENTIRYLIDGGEISAESWYYDPTLIQYDSGSFNIGRVAGSYFKGAIDDVLIFNKALTNSEIMHIYHLFQ